MVEPEETSLLVDVGVLEKRLVVAEVEAAVLVSTVLGLYPV